MRLMSKHFSVEKTEKGSPLQSKVNAFSKGKNITKIHGFAVTEGPHTKTEGEGDEKQKVQVDGLNAVLLYEASDEATDKRVLSKIVTVPVGSEAQSKVNSFTKDKELDILATDISTHGGEITVSVLYLADATAPDSEGSGEEAAEAPAAEEAPAEAPATA